MSVKLSQLDEYLISKLNGLFKSEKSRSIYKTQWIMSCNESGIVLDVRLGAYFLNDNDCEDIINEVDLGMCRKYNMGDGHLSVAFFDIPRINMYDIDNSLFCWERKGSDFFYVKTYVGGRN